MAKKIAADEKAKAAAPQENQAAGPSVAVAESNSQNVCSPNDPSP